MDVVQKEKLIQNMTDNLPTLRKKLNLSQEELSELIGVSRSTIAVKKEEKKLCLGICFCPCLWFSQRIKKPINC